MGHRRVGDQLLHVLLHHGHQADIDHGNQGQRNHQPGPFTGRVGRDRQRKAQETVGAELEHDGSQHGRTARRRLHVHVGQPGMDRPHRHLHGKGGEESKEQQCLRRTAERHFVPQRQIETATGLGVEKDQGNQHQQRAQQRVEEELESRVNLVRTAPDTDDQVHRNQRGLKEHVEQHAVECAEDTDHQAAENQESAHVLVHALGDDLPAGNHDHHIDEGCQQHEPERNAVNAQVIIDIEAGNPGCLFDKLHGSGAEFEAVIQRQRHQKTGNRTNQGDPAHGARLIVTTQCQQHNTKSNWCPNSQAQQSHFSYS